MSKEGQLIRGYKWSLTKTADGSYAKGVEENETRMADLQAYLDFVANRDKDKVHKILLNLRRQSRTPKVKTMVVKELKDMLKSSELVTSEAEPDYSRMTNAELKALLDERNISYEANATKADLLALLQGE